MPMKLHQLAMLVFALGDAGALAAASAKKPTFTTKQFPGYVGIAVSSPCLPLPKEINSDKNAACSQRYDLNNDGRPEIVARRASFDGKLPHSYTSIYTQLNGRWNKLMEVEGDWLFVSLTKRSQGWLDVIIGVSCFNEDEDSPLVCGKSIKAIYANGKYVLAAR